MTDTWAANYLARLSELSEQVRGTAPSVEEQARQPTGGEAAGGL